MAHLHKKLKKGRPYYYVREIARVDGKPKVVNQVYIGSPERILELASQKEAMPQKIQSQQFGALWLANLVEKEFDITGIIDRVVGSEREGKQPSVGEYFLFAIYNRMIKACSKRAMPDWYKQTAIQQIRPVKTDALTSQLFWQKWDKVEQRHLEQFSREFLRKASQAFPASSECFMFDTTNYYTFMASETESELAQRGKNKEGRNWLRQIGVALLVSRDTRLPLYYREYKGNRHDSKVFLQVVDDLFAAMHESTDQVDGLTVVFDKGMNSEDNIAAIDARQDVHFITSYSPHYCEELIHVDRSLFRPVDTVRNQTLVQKGRDDDRLTAWQTKGEFWGKERTVVVSYNPLTATKQRFGFEKKLLRMQEELFLFQGKVNRGAVHWRNKATIERRYADLCSELYLPADLYKVELSKIDGKLSMNFRKNHYRIGRYIDRFGKNIIITDRDDWSTDEIIQASLDRWMVEDSFRQSKDEDTVSLRPIRHWTDNKIRCHIFTCIAALALLRVIEIRLKKAGLNITAKSAMKSMHSLHSCLVWLPGKRKAERILEEPDATQKKILRAFGWEISGGVLQEK